MSAPFGKVYRERVAGRIVVDELPERLAVSDEEIELVSQFFGSILSELFGEAKEEKQ